MEDQAGTRKIDGADAVDLPVWRLRPPGSVHDHGQEGIAMPESSPNQPIDIRDALRPVKARLWLIVVCVALATALTYYHYSSQPKEYAASTKLYIGSSDPTQLANLYSSDRVTTDLAGIVTSPAVQALAFEELRASGNAGAALGSVSASPVAGSDFVTVSATSRSGAGAAALANAVADAFVTYRTNAIHQQAAKAIVQAEKQLAVLPNTAGNINQRGTLESTIQAMRGVQALPTAGITHIDPAYPPAVPFAPHPTKDAIFAFVIALMLTVAGAYGLDRLDRRMRKLAEIERGYGHSILAAVPRTRKPAPIVGGAAVLPDELREAFRTLRTNLELAALNRRPKTIVVASAIPREGKSTVVRNLALACREAGLQVCVIDADLRRPDIADLLGVPSAPGLTDVVVGDETLWDALKQARAGVPGQRALARLQGAPHTETDSSNADDDFGILSVLPSGPQPVNPPVVLGSDRMRTVLTTLAERFDIVIIDTSPLLAVSDAVPLLSLADGVLVVSRLDMTTSDAAEDLVEQLRRIPGANLLGVVANDVHGREAVANSYYGYGYARSRAVA